jgi:hypothetical protein
MNIQTTGLQRNNIDKFYTSSETVKKSMKAILKYIVIGEHDLCVEPSAGNGAFIELIKDNFHHYKFYDLEPEHNAIIKQDYLDLEIEPLQFGTKYKKIHVIGNPPFGRQSSLAIKFIKKSAEYCDSISFILPKSFKKDSLKRHFPLNFHLEHEADIKPDSFIVGGKAYDVACVFQIWIKKQHPRKISEKMLPNGFRFVNKTENPDISFRRVGVYAGKLDKVVEDKSEQSHYFIKFDNELTDEIFEKISSIEYETKNNTVGPKSISKQELIKEFNKVF